MLSQKIAKVMLLKNAGEDTTELKASLTSSKTIFERNLKILRDNSTAQSSKIKALIRNEFQEWGKFKAIMDKDVIGVDVLSSASQSLLNKCHALVLAIEEDSKFNKELSYSTDLDQLKVETVNLAGKQRMLSQRMFFTIPLANYLEKGKSAEVACNTYLNIYSEINKSVNDLLVNELNNTQIDTLLANILNIIDSIESRKKDFKENSIALGEMITMTNNMLDYI